MAHHVKLDEALLEATDHGLLVLGEIVRAALYQRIEKDYQVKRDQIPEKLPAFHTALLGLLGTGAKVLERLIARDLYKRLGLVFVYHGDWTLVDYVRHAKLADPRAAMTTPDAEVL